MKKTFLHIVKEQNKPLLVLIIIGICGQLFFTLKGVEAFPFVHWGMYSENLIDKEKTVPFDVYVDNRRVNITTLTDCQKAMVEGSLSKFAKLKKDNFKEKEMIVIDKRFSNQMSASDLQNLKSKLLNDSSSVSKYPAWLLGYLADLRMIKNPTLIVIQGSDTLINFDYDAI